MRCCDERPRRLSCATRCSPRRCRRRSIGDPVAAVERRAAARAPSSPAVRLRGGGRDGGDRRTDAGDQRHGRPRAGSAAPATAGSPPRHAPTTSSKHPATTVADPGVQAVVRRWVALGPAGGARQQQRPDATSTGWTPCTHTSLRRWTVRAARHLVLLRTRPGVGHRRRRRWLPGRALQVVNPATGSVRTLTCAAPAAERRRVRGRSRLGHRRPDVWEVDTDGAHVGTVTLPAGGRRSRGSRPRESGQIWVRTAKKWLRIDPASRKVVDSVQWTGPMLGAAGGDAIWTYDEPADRAVAVVAAPGGLSGGGVADRGARRRHAVAASSDGGLFVVAYDGSRRSRRIRAPLLPERACIDRHGGASATRPRTCRASRFLRSPRTATAA